MKADDVSLSAYYEHLETKKGDLHARCEQYARWTIPSVFPEERHGQFDTQQESPKSNVAIGARLVNHLAHRIVDTMFPNDRPFFAINMTSEAEKEIIEEAGDEGVLAQLRAGLAAVENEAVANMNLTAYRPVAVNTVIYEIVTGNAVIRRMEDDVRVVYSVRDYVLNRDITGKVLECILRDKKLFGELPGSLRDDLREANSTKARQYKDDAEVTLYTYYRREGKKWQSWQAVEDIDLEDEMVQYADADVPIIVLAWNLGRGDHYGRGLVEDYAVSFHNIDITTSALIDMIGIAADIKFLVNPGSGIDIDAFNEARRGEYVAGMKDDVSATEFAFPVEVQMLANAIDKWERELSQAFLLQSAGVRDAERVTAEEIRFFAREIESAFGGLYSRLALDWQKREAEYQISKINFKQYLGGRKAFDIMVTTGLESLSREGKLDSLRLAVSDLTMLQAIPEQILMAIHPIKFAAYIFRNRNVPAEEFLLTQEEYQQAQNAEHERQQALQQQQIEGQAATQAMK